MEEEIWKEVPGYNGRYEVSDLGRVRTVKYPSGRMRESPIIRKQKTKNGYSLVILNGNKAATTYLVHRLVLSSFTSFQPRHIQCMHLNHIRLDNRLENLKWGTNQDNMNHMVKDGRQTLGERNPMAKLKNHDIIEIRYLKKLGLNNCQIADVFGIQRESVRDILLGKKWSHIK